MFFYYGYCIIFEAIKDLFQNLKLKHYVRKILDCTFDSMVMDLALVCTYRCFPISYEY